MTAPTSEQSVSLLTEAQGLIRKPGFACGVAAFRDAHPDLAAEFDEAVSAPIQASAVSEALRRRGFELSAFTINRHRRSDCACRVAH